MSARQTMNKHGWELFGKAYRMGSKILVVPIGKTPPTTNKMPPWSPEHKAILWATIRTNGATKKTFNMLSKKLGRTYGACTAKYGNIQHKLGYKGWKHASPSDGRFAETIKMAGEDAFARMHAL